MSERVVLHPLRQFPDDRGCVLHMLRSSDPYFERFGEIYFSTIRRSAIKAWHRHTRKTVNFAVPIGKIRLVIFDGEVHEYVTGRDDYELITIQPGVWYGFQGLAEGESLLANCATEPFDSAEGDDLPFDAPEIPYHWP